MTIYKVYYERVAYDTGRFEGYTVKGYYANKEKAEKAKNRIKKGMTVGNAYIAEIKVKE